MRSFFRSLVVFSVVCASPCLRSEQEYHFTAAGAHPVASIQDRETPAQRNARMAWWREARFGMFIHWGLYAVPAGTWDGKQVPHLGEWIMNHASIPVADYKALAPKFDPVGFSAHDIVALAKSAGMRYIVITSKHHDGFAMFDSGADPFNIVAATPFHRDPLRELADECRKQGIKLGFYYSQSQDWTAPGGDAYVEPGHDPQTGRWDKAQDGDFDSYVHTKAIPQIRELLSQYGEFPSVIWFDTGERMTPQDAADIVTLLNQHPKLIWNNRLGGGYQGDTETPEQYVPATGYPDGRDWESCMTINDTWGYKSYDMNFKSTETLLRNLIDIASKGGNYLLNVGPDANGVVPQPEQQRLREMGAWLSVNGEAVYGTSASLFTQSHMEASATETGKDGKPKQVPVWDWRSTTKKDRVYVEVFAWPKGTLKLPSLARKVTGAYVLNDPRKALKIVQTTDGVEIALPAKAPDPMATVVVLKTAV